ncbi:cytochrome b5 domain-containing protein [Ectothiorhodospira mobilis]|uniref:cytochrome b5 domain-containing protein n=1 Tax=Ectothiorhodospira mobilis TaxID=195064 RepID=UPI001EE9ACDC|nr:cytochrome b5-like heme/steroid binding domain-containing protein [Ectothiorhodospira mobilis]MCG5535387.1 cytochrome b5 domain-containing protein [Ectothiorhodospira mobilis]
MATSAKPPLLAILALVALYFPGGLAAQDTHKESKPIPLQEVARHDHRKDCWMVIDAQVYDITDYLPRHPGSMDPVLEWCGREATEAWDTKGDADSPRVHSRGAHYLLQRYHLGPLAPEDASHAPGEAAGGQPPERGKRDEREVAVPAAQGE